MLRRVMLIVFLVPSLSWGTTYYVGKAGSNSNNCSSTAPSAQNIATPKLTINGGIACLASGDTLIVRDGVYDNDIISDTAGVGGYGVVPPSGASFASPTTIRTENSRGATIQVSSPPGGGWNAITSWSNGSHHIILQGFIINGKLGRTQITRCADLSGAHHMRYQDIECSWPQNQGIYTAGTNTFHEFINVDIHDNGKHPTTGAEVCTGSGEGIAAGFCHGYYLSEHAATGILIQGGSISRIDGYGVQAYSSTVTVRDVTFADILQSAVITLTGGVTFYNNVIINSGICIYVIGSNNTIVQNTAYGSTGASSYCVYNRNDGTNNLIKNNLVMNRVSNSERGYFFVEGGAAPSGNLLVSNPTLSGAYAGNICNATNMVGCTITAQAATTLTTNPSGGNFHLLTGSAAVDAGVNTGITVDKDQTPRSGNYDVGAYELGVGTLPIPTNLRVGP